MLTPIVWFVGRLRLLDQTRLPNEEVWLTIGDQRELAEAIRSLRVRGAPAIGVAAAYGLALVAQDSGAATGGELLEELNAAADELRATRLTALTYRALTASRAAEWTSV
jgi:methylthioribose-1-phosphate isomerase